MDTKGSLTILFEDPFWVGLYERIDASGYSACKITFGPEPKDYEVYAFLLANWSGLVFSPSVPAEQAAEKRVNPKRMQREINRQLQNTGVGTKAQQALSLQREQNKQERVVKSRAQKEARQEAQFALRQQKKKEKHKGR